MVLMTNTIPTCSLAYHSVLLSSHYLFHCIMSNPWIFIHLQILQLSHLTLDCITVVLLLLLNTVFPYSRMFRVVTWIICIYLNYIQVRLRLLPIENAPEYFWIRLKLILYSLTIYFIINFPNFAQYNLYYVIKYLM